MGDAGSGGNTLGACVRPSGPVTTPAVAAATISYETGPCYGRCPAYRFTVAGNGEGVFTGLRDTAVIGERAFRVSPAEYSAFAGALAPHRPAAGTVRRYADGLPGCEQAATDMPSAEVKWREGGREGGRESGLSYYFGCHTEEETGIGDAIGNAPDLLPALEPLIGPRP